MSVQHHEKLLSLERDIIKTGLCTRCGTCVGVCPSEKIHFVDVLDTCLPETDRTLSCEECPGYCLDACPGRDVDFPAMNEALFGRQPESYLLGIAEEWHVAWASDPEIRAAGASGGVLTAMVKYLLDEGIVKGVACLIDDLENPLFPKPVIARDMDTLRLAQQSKYSLAPLNVVLRQVEKFDGPVAYVALPDQVHALRKLQQMEHPSVRNIKVILGSYCGAIQHFTAIAAFLRKNGIRDLERVARVEYRAGAWPGKLRVTLKDGATFELDKFYANYMTLFYSVERSLLCVDLSNEFADISFGDAWAPRYEERHEGFNLIAVRTDVGKEIFDACREAEVVQTEASSWKDAAEMHSHGLYNKKYAVWSRMTMRRWLLKPVPYYGYTVDRTLMQKFMGLFIGSVFIFGRTWIARLIVQILPLELTGRVFSWVRTKWRTATRPKRADTVKTYRVRFLPRDRA